MILFQQHLIEIEYDIDHKLLQVRWTDPLSIVSYRQALKKIIEIISAYEVKSLLLETYNSPGSDHKNELWKNNFFLNKYRKIGLKKIARVCLDSATENLQISSWLQKEQTSDVEFRQFKYQFEAYDWLLEQDKEYLYLRYGT